MDAAVKKLFQDYARAFDTLEVEKQANYFADTFISAGPKGTIAQNRDEFMKLSGKARDFYRSVGQTGAEILSMKETPISKEYSMVRVHWGVTFEKTGDKPVEFDVSYFVQKTGDSPKIIMFIAHEDENEAMKKLGLMQSAA